MKIYLPVDSLQEIGGGFTFQRNLEKGLKSLGHEIVYGNDYRNADTALVSGVTMVKRETIDKIQEAKIKLVVRIDNVPRNSRNRNTGTSRLKEFAIRADEIVWQCQWCKDYLIDFIGREGRIIHNGVDTDIFKPEGERYHMDWEDRDLYLYSRFSRDEIKNWEVGWYEYQLIQKENPNAKLILVGQFSPEQIEYNFDFFKGENFEYLGVIHDPFEMAKIYRSCKYLLATYFNDCYSNTYAEAIASGCELYEPNMSGGTPELIKNGVIPLKKMVEDYIDLFKEVIEKS